jgi:WD40 repeat protein
MSCTQLPFRLMVAPASACYAARILRSPAMMPASRSGRRGRLLAIVALVAWCSAERPAHARADDGVRPERVSHREHAKQPKPPAQPVKQTPVNVHLAPAGAIALPGRGLSLAWSPDGTRLAVGGHFRDKATRLRYDTRIANVASRTLVKSCACHWFWAVSQAWIQHPDYGALLADGGGDHAVKVWNPGSRGSTTCHPGQFLSADGALQQLGEIDGWIVSLAFSPDRRWLAGASRDRTIRIWQVHPGPNAWRVVALWFDRDVGNFLSVDWAPDGRAVVTGDRRGRVAVWDVDPDRDRWDDATIAQFARTSYEGQASWFGSHTTMTSRTPRWSESGHGVVWNARWAPDGSRVAAAGTDGSLSVYAAGTGEVLSRQMMPKPGSLNGLAWHPGSRWLAAGGSDDRIYVYDTQVNAPYDVLEGHDDLVTALAWSPDGATLASTAGGPLLKQALVEVSDGPDQTIRLWRWR